ncbi:HET-domain-containing protein [Bimuria novae-zelandiae CBS 107.79]|uniref:HET-domain-containing protein n=1 Tax=Bimuria novae-zelandiae CBS 107.79 TaxID=1447943 RepID=A0A6A5V8V5_9PLEO|nr:HET-domain-containing protein [Bimuria novae-zelandiae CBS 107.79]
MGSDSSDLSVSYEPEEWAYPATKRYRLRRTMLPFLPYLDKAGNTGPSSTESVPAYDLDTEWIDLDVIRHWLHTCDESHKAHCNTGITDLAHWRGPVWLIDVYKRCVVSVSSPMKYFALSYVWGKEDTTSCLALGRANLRELQVPGALRSGHPGMPKLLDDVISLVAALGTQYLWIDRLCIVQDGGLEKSAEINRMDTIYAGAYATIVAAQPELRGLPSITGPRDYNISQEMYSTEAKGHIAGRRYSGGSMSEVIYSTAEHFKTDREVLENLSAKLMQSKWYSRGWTFQEQLFSKRLIVFHDDTVNWECHCCAFHEAQGRIIPDSISQCERGSTALENTTNMNMPIWPDMYRYARLVSLFNSRELSFPSDVTDAFAGVLSHLSRSYDGGFISGIPALFFDAALLWQPYGPLERRKAGSFHAPDAGSVLPSWSWAGWHGTLQSESWRSAYAYLPTDPDFADIGNEERSEPISWTTFPTRRWYYLDDHGERHPIKNPPPSDKDHEIDDRWQRTDCGAAGKSYWNIRGQDTQNFIYPITLRDPHSAPTPPIKALYITTTTARAHLKAGSLFTNRLTSFCLCVKLHHPSASSDAIGFLRFPFDTDEQLPTLRSATYEIIELSRGKVENRDTEKVAFDEWDQLDWSTLGDLYEFANVMAISWKDGVTYREAVGRVEWGAWSALEKEDVDVVLG